MFDVTSLPLVSVSGVIKFVNSTLVFGRHEVLMVNLPDNNADPVLK